jgi:hypothetical protein
MHKPGRGVKKTMTVLVPVGVAMDGETILSIASPTIEQVKDAVASAVLWRHPAYGELADDVRERLELRAGMAKQLSDAASRIRGSDRRGHLREQDLADLARGETAAWRIYEQACSEAMQALTLKIGVPPVTED